METSETEFSAWERLLIMYGAQHRHPVNVGIHLIFVPLIMFSILFALTLIEIPLGQWLIPLSWIFAFIVAIYYWTLDRFSTLLMLPLIALMLFIAHQLAALLGEQAWIWAVGGIVFGYGMQFIGHAIDKTKPALVEHPVRGNLAAPLFVLVEISRWLGFRKELFERVENEIIRREQNPSTH